MHILLAGGYIGTKPGSSTHSKFKVVVRYIDLFNVDRNIKQKLIDVQALVENSVKLNSRRVDITGVTGYNDLGGGVYFDIAPSHFGALGLGHENGGIYSAKQYGKDDRETWSGSNLVGIAHGKWYGRRSTGAVAG